MAGAGVRVRWGGGRADWSDESSGPIGRVGVNLSYWSPKRRGFI